jgi:hypothetical protein
VIKDKYGVIKDKYNVIEDENGVIQRPSYGVPANTVMVLHSAYLQMQ